jgi:hypothetical protein
LIKGRKLWLNYKGSRNGFQASDYHDKNLYVPTLTIIETTSGEIFGGYSSLDETVHYGHNSHQMNLKTVILDN